MFHSACLFGKTNIFVYAGRAAPSQPFSTAYLLDTTTMSWRKPSLMPAGEDATLLPQARWRHTATTLNTPQGEIIVIFGGRIIAGKHDYIPTDEIWCIDPVSLKTWPLSIKGDSRPASRFSHAAVAIDNGTKLLINGGTDGKNRFSDSWILDLQQQTWTCVTSPVVPPARFAHAMSVFTHQNGQEYVLLVGGCSPMALNDMHMFDVASSKWNRILHTFF